jgi:hypothetical protein
MNSKIASSSRKKGMVFNLDLKELGPRVGLGILKKVKIRYSYGQNKETLLECECLVDSTSLICSNGRSASVLEDRRQTARLNLVVFLLPVRQSQ